MAEPVLRRWCVEVGILAVVGLLLGGCDDGAQDSTDGTDGTSADGGDASGEDTGESACLGMGGPNPVDASCRRNDDCASGVCAIFTDAPVNEDAVCLEAPSDCSTVITGMVRDFETGTPMADVPLVVVGALDAVKQGIDAPALSSLRTNEHGLVQGQTDGPLDEQLAVLGMSATEGYALTVTGIAQPPLNGGRRYEVGLGIHDMWVVPLPLLDAWSATLATDPDIPAELLPLTQGAVIGRVRDGATGQPIAGADVVADNPESAAIVRALADDGTFQNGPTGSSGIFVVLHPATPEVFAAYVDGQEVGRASAGFIPGGAFVAILQHLP